MLDNLFPVEVPVLGVHDNPVHAERHGHLRDARRLERHPESEHGRVTGEFTAQATESIGLHAVALTTECAVIIILIVRV